MARQYMRFLTAISILLLMALPWQTGLGCGPDLPVDANLFLLFQREMPGDAAFQPFYYTGAYMYDYSPDPMSTDQHINCNEWRGVTGGTVKEKDIYQLEYTTTPDQYLYSSITGNWGSFAENTFVQWLLQKQNKPAAQYFAFAKKVEFEADNDNDPWLEKNHEWGEFRECNMRIYDSLIAVALTHCRSEAPFLRERYAFQAVKLLYYRAFYGHDNSSRNIETFALLRSCYETYLKDKPTIVAGWGMLYYAQAQTDPVRQTYYLVKAFDETNAKKVFVYLNVHRNELAVLEHNISDRKVLAAVAAIKGLKNRGRALEQLQDVVMADPSSPYVAILAGREINKLEDWLVVPDVNWFSYDIKNKGKDRAYLRTFRQYLINLVEAENKNNDLLKLGIAHLYNIDNNYAAAATYLQEVHPGANRVAAVQLEIEKALCLMNGEDIKSVATKQKLNDVFAHLEALGVQDIEAGDEERDEQSGAAPRRLMGELYLMLSAKYREKGDVVTAGLLFQKSHITVDEYFGEYYSHEWRPSDSGRGACMGSYYYRIAYFEKFAAAADMDKLISFSHKKMYTPFEKRLVPCAWPEDDVYLDVKGTLLLRQEKYKEALAVFNKMDARFWANNYQFAQYLRKNSVTGMGTFLPAQSGNGRRYTYVSKKEIVQDIVNEQEALHSAATDSARAAICFMLGNCYYNIAYPGRDWMAVNYGKGSGEQQNNNFFATYSFRAANEQQYKNYYRCARATELYRQALHYGKRNPELSAQCVLMLAACDKTAHDYATPYRYNAKPYFSPYLAMLASKYKETATFDNSTTDCPDVAEYMKGR